MFYSLSLPFYYTQTCKCYSPRTVGKKMLLFRISPLSHHSLRECFLTLFHSLNYLAWLYSKHIDHYTTPSDMRDKLEFLLSESTWCVYGNFTFKLRDNHMFTHLINFPLENVPFILFCIYEWVSIFHPSSKAPDSYGLII